MKFPVLVVLLLLSSVVASAQTESARISGRVTDLSGGVIVGAQCKITNIETDVSVTTSTYEDGPYLPNWARAARNGTLETSISPP
jgi:hypothetical protein